MSGTEIETAHQEPNKGTGANGSEVVCCEVIVLCSPSAQFGRSILLLSWQIVNVLFLLGGPQSGNGYQGLIDFFYVWGALQTIQVLLSVFC